MPRGSRPGAFFRPFGTGCQEHASASRDATWAVLGALAGMRRMDAPRGEMLVRLLTFVHTIRDTRSQMRVRERC